MTNYEWGSFAPLLRGDQAKLVGAVSMYRTAARPVAPPRIYTGFHSDGQGKLLGPSEHCPDICKKFNDLHLKVSTERNPAQRQKQTDELIQLISDAWVGVPVVEGMGTWVANRGRVGAFRAIPGR
ncbi:MAG: hypothetical protein FJY56_21025, partial [Betaproteobacteria bacterium]|nr:hypothetical protein [Betaproteobacteria bacterium]